MMHFGIYKMNGNSSFISEKQEPGEIMRTLVLETPVELFSICAVNTRAHTHINTIIHVHTHVHTFTHTHTHIHSHSHTFSGTV